MSTKKTTAKNQPVNELLEKGELTLTADSKQALFELAEELTASIPEGTAWSRSMYECKDGVFMQHYKILKPTEDYGID